jgi:hypothetical protein
MPRFVKSPQIEKSPFVCPVCRDEMNLSITAFDCMGALNGPYASVRVALACGSRKCGYLESTKAYFSTNLAMKKLQRLAQQLIHFCQTGERARHRRTLYETTQQRRPQGEGPKNRRPRKKR